VYSAALYIITISRKSTLQADTGWSHWADVCWYLLLVALSSGTSSIFFFFFFFSTLIASFRWGFESGLRVVLVSALLFTIIGSATAPAGPEFELNRFLLRPIYLIVLGYMVAYWGGQEIILKRRLALLKEVSMLSNPRFGVDRTIAVVIERLRAFYDAETCMLVILNSGEYRSYRATRQNSGQPVRPEIVAPEFAGRLIDSAGDYAFFHTRRKLPWAKPSDRFRACGKIEDRQMPDAAEAMGAVSSVLDSHFFITLPLFHNAKVIGRVYLTDENRDAFNSSDLDFLLQVFEQVMPVIENIRLVDRLASNAAEEERQRIARNIHDSVIQPYIGLRIGLGTVHQKLAGAIDSASIDCEELTSTVTSMVSRLDQLIGMTNTGIDDLRNYITQLKGTGDRDSTLLPSIRQFVAKFGEVTGISVQVAADGDIHISDRLAAEVFQMVVEGLSNVRRHTQAGTAVIRVGCSNGYMSLNIENDGANEPAGSRFTPHSISSRAESLGGRALVHVTEQGRTVVSVMIPL
jgi:signal transduction histidine kinase